ncbi:Hsp70 family protein [Calditrichota bacterium LG25]
MAQRTIDFGIDLGTTNSTIAKLNGTEVHIFKNNEGFEFTPSAVWIDNKGRIHVGRRAKERLEDDPENAYSEFKLQMGTDNEYVFSRNNRRMKPEELSAEILKSLKTDVKYQTGKDLTSAVITVPAAFELPQCKATQLAAELAGFTTSPLLQEPVAAAMAYGFQSESDKVFWLVYDFGGGTFDAAIIQVRDGIIEVVNHGGDNHLGGKLIDWEIVNQIFVPSLTKEYKLPNFRRDNPKWRSAFAKLKAAAEKAKIRLSREDVVEDLIEYLCKDENGTPVEFHFELSKSELNQIAMPFILRSINICRIVLTEKRLGVGDIEKVILVGGTTLIPILRDMLSDRNEGLGIPLESSHYPITVVAEGAAIFAGTQFVKDDNGQVSTDQFLLELDYKPIGADVEPLIGGKVIKSEIEDYTGFTIEFINKDSRPEWRSGKIELNPEGGFITNLWAEKGRKNKFQIELLDPKGVKLKTNPESIYYTIGISITDPPLIHSVGVAMADNKTDFFFKKGTPLPARCRKIHRTVFEVRKGQDGDLIRIPVVEGENQRRADRNRLIGYLEIPSNKIERTVPAGSEIEITIEIDRSRIMKTKAYIPILDTEYEEVINLEKTKSDPDKLYSEFEREKKRLEDIKKKIKIIKTGDETAKEILEQIENEQILHEIESALDSVKEDRDSVDRCQNRLLDLEVALDKAEDALEWPALMVEAKEGMKNTEEIVTKYGNTSEKQAFLVLEEELNHAMRSHEPDLLRQKIDQMEDLRFAILREQPGFWVSWFEYLVEMDDKMTDHLRAKELIAEGRRAIANNDLERLKSTVKQLISLLPPDQQEEAKERGSTLNKF